MLLAHRPELGHQDIDNWINQHSVGNCKPAVHDTQAKHGCGNCNESIRCVQITTEQKPGDYSPEAPPGQAPFVDEIEIAAPPACGNEAHAGHNHKKIGRASCREECRYQKDTKYM